MTITAVLLTLAFIIPNALTICRQSYITVCTNFEDIDKSTSSENYNELLIGSTRRGTKSSSKYTSVNLSKFMSKFRNLNILMIIGKLDRLETIVDDNKKLKCLHQLDVMNLYGNRLAKIEKDQFPKMYIGKLSLLHNRIKELKKGAFHNHKIKIIDISDNQLKRIENGSLPQTRSLRVVKIRNNKLTEIQPNSFPKNVHSLHLDLNNLSNLTGVLDRLGYLEELTLSHNKFAVLPNITYLKRLRYLDMSFNRIKILNGKTFEQLTKLELINFANNKLHDPNLLMQFSQHPNKLLVSVAFNQMTELNIKGLKNKGAWNFLTYGNPWNCAHWKSIARTLLTYENKCGKAFYSSGKTPYCINYDQWSGTRLEKQLSKFYDAIKKNANLVGCTLEPNYLAIRCPELLH